MNKPSKLPDEREFNFDPPREHGYDTVEAIKAMHDGRGQVFFALGGNFLSATPDTEYTAMSAGTLAQYAYGLNDADE